MKTLLFLRHAKSDWYQTGDDGEAVADIERPLSNRGLKAGRLIRDFLKERSFNIDCVEYSTARRAKMTFDLIKPSLESILSMETQELYTFNYKCLLKKISKTQNTISNLMIIGHNPAFQEAITFLANPKLEKVAYNLIERKYPTGALAVLKLNIIDWKDLSRSCGYLYEFLTPSELKRQ